jgi:glutamine phosphoribosylpyrophosphate amidotransferase
MCGLFGYIGTSPEWPLLKQAAYEAGRRGPNAWGVAWLDEQKKRLHFGTQRGDLHDNEPVPIWLDGIQVYKQPGKLAEDVDRLPTLVGKPSALIGQSRLATSGTYRTNDNNPPFVVRGIALAHNGNVYNARELTAQHHLEPETACDSEVLAQLIAVGRGSLLDRVTWAVEQVDARSPLSVLAMDGTGIVAVRRGQPLYGLLQLRDAYLCSRPFANSELLPDGAAFFFWQRGDEIVVRKEVL